MRKPGELIRFCVYRLVAGGLASGNSSVSYGRRIVPLLRLKNATTIMTKSAGTTFKYFMPGD